MSTTSSRALEAAKFGLYVAIPFGLMYAFGSNSTLLQWIIRNRSYVVYPPEGPRPPSPEEIMEMVRKAREKETNRTP